MTLPTHIGDSPDETGSSPLVTESFRDFSDRLAAGEDAAAAELLARYSARLVSLARRNLGAKLAAKTDPEDVVQSVLRTFFRRLAKGEVELRDWSSLAGLLALLTVRRCNREGRHYTTAGRDANREVPLSAFDGTPHDVPDREPTPAEVAAFADLVDQLLANLNDRDRAVVEAVLQGESVAEVAARINRTETTVYRALRRVQDQLLHGPLGRKFF